MTAPHPIDDGPLLEALHDGEAAHVALATRVLGNRDDALDAVQEARLRAWRHRGGLKEGAALHGWLRTIVARECYRLLRRRPSWSPEVEAPDRLRSPERVVADAEAHARIRDALAALPARQRLVWSLRWEDDRSVGEIAAATGTSPETVKTHLERAGRTVRRRLLLAVAILCVAGSWLLPSRELDLDPLFTDEGDPLAGLDNPTDLLGEL